MEYKSIISQKLGDCAWAVGDLGERAYLQDEVVSRVRAIVRGCACGFWVSNCP